MICRRCLHRASALVAPRPSAPSSSSSSSSSIPQTTTMATRAAIRARHPAVLPLPRPFSQTTRARSSSPAPSPPSSSDPPVLSTPLASPATTADGSNAPATAAPLSSCAEGTVLVGLNYFKNKTDPVALADDAYPEWLWQCNEVQKKAREEAADDAGDEFSKSKKQRKLALKRQRALEARLLAEGNLEALAPKIPLQQQTINLPANEEGTTEGAVAAAAAREELRKAMRRERRAGIKESNYLKSM